MKNFVLFLIFILPVHPALNQNLDIDILKNINLNRDRSLDPTFKFITNSVTPMTIALPAGFIVKAFIKKDSCSRQDAYLIATSMIITDILATSVKYAVHRERPFETYPFIEKETSGGSYSFPSGHTAAAFGLATSISMVYPKWYIITPSFLWAAAVGYSRMDLGVHYPSDVLMGAIVGSGSAFLSYKLNRWINKKKKSK